MAPCIGAGGPWRQGAARATAALLRVASLLPPREVHVTTPLCHVLDRSAWERARLAGHLPPPASEGFLHCCTPAQLGFVAARHFAGVPGLLVLRFDPARVAAPLRWVRSEPDQPPFPHLHGPLPAAAVLDARPLEDALRDDPA